MPSSSDKGFQPSAKGETYVVVCRRCDGRGHFHVSVHSNHDSHKPEYTSVRETCQCCEGSGRMLCRKTYTPYKP